MTTKNIDQAKTDIAAAIAAGAALATPPTVQTLHDQPFAFLPEGVTVHDLSKYLPRPVAIDQQVHLHTPDAFIEYLRKFAEAARTLVFADASTASFMAAIDYHAPTEPSFVRHRAHLKLRQTPEFTAWRERNGKHQNQTDFAQFVEDHIPQIARPDGADLVAMIRTFEAKKDVAFKSAMRATDGSVTFQYMEDVQGSPNAATMRLPEKFELVMSVYEGAEPCGIVARLRFRIGDGGRLALWYDLIELQRIVDTEFEKVLEVFSEKLSGVVSSVVRGTIGA